jgi:hypothetical protein
MFRVKPRLLLLAFCLCARVVVGAETVAAVVKQSLGFDLSSVPFGTTASANRDFRAVDPPPLHPSFVTNVLWMTNTASGWYTCEFPHRAVRYGFRDDRLVVIQISALLWNVVSTTPETVDRSPEITQIRDELRKHRSPGENGFEDTIYRLQYESMCGEIDEHPVRIDVQIAPLQLPPFLEPPHLTPPSKNIPARAGRSNP